MLREPFHLSDQDILLVVDGEVSGRRARQALAHLDTCSFCRSRLGELEGTIAEFVALHQSTQDPTLPSSTGSRALLKARLAEAAAAPSVDRWPRLLPLLPHRAAAYICVAIITVMGGAFLVRHSQRQGSMPSDLSLVSLTIPNHSLTPGATRPVTIGDVCSKPHEEEIGRAHV